MYDHHFEDLMSPSIEVASRLNAGLNLNSPGFAGAFLTIRELKNDLSLSSYEYLHAFLASRRAPARSGFMINDLIQSGARSAGQIFEFPPLASVDNLSNKSEQSSPSSERSRSISVETDQSNSDNEQRETMES